MRFQLYTPIEIESFKQFLSNDGIVYSDIDISNSSISIRGEFENSIYSSYYRVLIENYIVNLSEGISLSNKTRELIVEEIFAGITSPAQQERLINMLNNNTVFLATLDNRGYALARQIASSVLIEQEDVDLVLGVIPDPNNL